MRTSSLPPVSFDGLDDSLLPRPTAAPAAATVTSYEPSHGLATPPVDEARLVRLAKAAETWERISRAHPTLAQRLPAYCTTPSAKLLFILASRELSKAAGPLTVSFGEADSIRRTASGTLELRSGARPTLRLGDQHGDLQRLLEGAQARAHRGEGPFDGIETSSVESLLGAAVHDFYSAPEFTGGGAAPSERGGRLFAYTTFEQVLVSDDPSQRGFECLASAAFHLYLSMGLIPPDLTRQELEHRYTELHGDPGVGTPRLGSEFTRSLRGGPATRPGERRFGASATADFANQLRATDWAKLTGASKGLYAVRSLPTIDDVVTNFETGGGAVHTTWSNGGHYFVLSGATRDGDSVMVDQDDSLHGSRALRSEKNPRPNRTSYDPWQHTRFWTLERLSSR